MRFLSVLLFAMMALLAATSVFAQAPITSTSSNPSSYVMTYVDSVPPQQPLNFSNPFTSGSNGVRQNIDIGFTFQFYGLGYTKLGVGYNGNVQWGSSQISGLIPASIPTSGVTVPILGWFATDLNCVNRLCGGGYTVVGSAPNRQFIIRATNWTYQTTSASAGTGDVDADIVLFETTNVIEIRYYSVSPLPPATPAYQVTIGVQQTTANWLAVLSASTTVDPSTYLQGRTIVLTPTSSLPMSSSAGPAPEPLPLTPTNGANPFYVVVAADSVPPKVEFNLTGSSFTSGWNGVRENVEIGFTFYFFGVPYTQLGVGYNGNLQWGSSEVSGVLPNGIPSVALEIPVLAWFAADLNCVQGVGGGGYGLIGEAPNRQFIIRANNWSYQVGSGAGAGTGDIDIDIVLTETENTIVVRYYSVSALPSSSYLVTVGVQNAQSDDWTSILSQQTGFDVTQTLQGRSIIFAPNA